MNTLANDKLIETRNHLLNEINLLSYDEFNKKPNSNEWSIAQICHHLYLVESKFTQAIEYGLKKIDGHETERKNIYVVSDKTVKLNAPDMVKPDVEPFEVQKIIELLSNSRNSLMTVLSNVEDSSVLSEKSAKHPFFGELPIDQWIDLVSIHEQRHIEQIKDIKLRIATSN
ncbi:DinB family protein [Bacillus sp. RG28]|uniref:DinB family protein n=1 Tax=Gottfriedia endophytica TaxID=2820819 RepID=A0A940NH22_9BACI|nr:DinB family protein [Gottfriedia endophytica]MBP0725274.1 DinB family protein [Gottfriedia endophytica]